MAAKPKEKDRGTPLAELQPFIISDVQFTGVELGRGAYGTVQEVRIAGAICASKQIHGDFLQEGTVQDIDHLLKAFAAECLLLSNLRHPNIVQFFGISKNQNSEIPVLLMEKLDCCLHTMLENSLTITMAVKHSILRDVACGLVYLHSHDPSVIHRDLTARNILLTSRMVAKITDLGVARIIDLKQGRMMKTMTNAPGNVVYMPPEAMEAGCKYDTSMDVFSFGNVSLFTLTQTFPELLAATYPHPKKDKVVGRTEIERRGKCFGMLKEMLGDKHSLVNLVTKCLQNKPNSRPTAQEILQKLDNVKIEDHDKFEIMSKKDLLQYVETREREMERLVGQLGMQQSLINSQAEQIESFQVRFQETNITARIQETDIQTRYQQTDIQARLHETDIQTRHQEMDIQARLQETDIHQETDIQSQQQGATAIDSSSNFHRTTHSLDTQLNFEPCLSLQTLSSPMAEMHNSQSPLTSEAKLQDMLCPQSIQWEKQPPIPYDYKKCLTKSVTVGHTVYVGCYENLMSYRPQLNQWKHLPALAPLNDYKMTVVNGQLTLVEDTPLLSPLFQKQPSRIIVWDEATQRYTAPYPPLPHLRQEVAVAGYKHYLIIIAGVVRGGFPVNSVEILDTMERKWYTADSIPWKNRMNKTICVGDTIVVLCGYCFAKGFMKKIVTAPLPVLISQAKSQDHKKALWKTLPEIPLHTMIPLTSKGKLLLVDGSTKNFFDLFTDENALSKKRSSKVYSLDANASKWVVVGEIPEPIYTSVYAVLPSGDLFIAGVKNNHSHECMDQVYIGKLTF